MPDTPQNSPKNKVTQDDPIQSLAEILRDDKLTKEDKQFLFDESKQRFKHRRRMAYIALGGIFLTAIVSGIPNVDLEGTGWVHGTLTPSVHYDVHVRYQGYVM